MKYLHRIKTLAAIGALIGGFSSPTMACTPDGYIGQMTVFAGNFAIRGCAFAQGQLLAIDQNTALFAILGTTYGGDGRTTFALPDLRGRSVVGAGNGIGLTDIRQGQKGGVERITLSINNLPGHSHGATTTTDVATASVRAVSGDGDTDVATGAVWATLSREDQYSTAAPDVTMASDAVALTVQSSTAIGNTGGGQSFNNRNPYLGMYWLIQTQGIFPSRN